MQWKTEPLRLLDTDWEAKPGHWIGGDFVSKLPTAGAWAWVGKRPPRPHEVFVVSHYEMTRAEMLTTFREFYDEADVIVTHYGRGFDFPLLNRACRKEGLPPLEPKLTIDTKNDLLKSHGGSSSQKNLSAERGLKSPKEDLTLDDWEGFNERAPGYEARVIERVVGDVIQNVELFLDLRDEWLSPPSVWTPSAGHSPRYSG